MTQDPLRDRFIKWVEGYAAKSCPDGYLPFPAQEREIALFAEVARALADPQPEPDRIVANEDCLNCVCRDDQLCRGTEPRKAPQPAPLGREALDPMKLCDEWQGSQRRHSGFAIDELNAFMAGVKAADAILASTPAPSVDRAAIIEAERRRCLEICEGWIGTYQDREIQFTSAREYAVDAIEDIIDLIRDGHDPALAATEGKP